MAEISRAMGNEMDAEKYDVGVLVPLYFFRNAYGRTPQNQTSALLGEWVSLALSSDKSRILGFYNDESSDSLLYNIYADRLLGTNLIPQSVSIHSFWYTHGHLL